MQGVFIKKGLSDWQIIQHQNGEAQITLSGSWIVPRDAIKQGVERAEPVIRVLTEEDNVQVISWTKTECTPEADGFSGVWKATLTIPAGGLYRLETGLMTVSTLPGVTWLFRGDTRLHFGVGDVFLIGGQSNSAGYGKDPAFDPPELGVHIFRNRRSWDLASHPLNESTYNADAPNAEMGVSGNSPYLSFGKNFKKLSHYPVGLIATAKGGMPMKRWKPGAGSLYRNMLEQARACGPLAGILWYQGCSDTDKKSADYEQNYFEMIRAFRKDLGYPVRFFTFQLNREVDSPNDRGYGIVREAQRKAAHCLEEVYVLPTITCGLSDGIHNSAHACIKLGEHMARLCGHVLYGTPDWQAPEITGAFADGNCVKLRFDHVRFGFVIPGGGLPDSCGFSVFDKKGHRLPFTSIKADPEEKSSLLIQMNEPVPENCTVSFAWEANPTWTPLMDEVTFLPPLSFYQYPVTQKR